MIRFVCRCGQSYDRLDDFFGHLRDEHPRPGLSRAAEQRARNAVRMSARYWAMTPEERAAEVRRAAERRRRRAQKRRAA